MHILSLPNLIAYNLQVAAIVLLATIVVALLRVDVPGVRYVIWRVVLALCLVLPFIQGRQVPATAASGDASIEMSLLPTAVPAAGQDALPFDWTGAALPVIAAGVLARLGWLALSFGRLQRLRRRGEAGERVDKTIVAAAIRYRTRASSPRGKVAQTTYSSAGRTGAGATAARPTHSPALDLARPPPPAAWPGRRTRRGPSR